MKADRITVFRESAEDIHLDAGAVQEKNAHVYVSAAQDKWGTSDLEGCLITVSGEKTGETNGDVQEREFVYSGRIKSVKTSVASSRLKVYCSPPDLDHRAPVASL